MQLQVLLQPFDGTIHRGSNRSVSNSHRNPNPNSNRSNRPRRPSTRLGEQLVRTASNAMHRSTRGRLGGGLGGLGGGLLGSGRVSGSSKRSPQGLGRWPAGSATEPPIDLDDVADIDRFKIEQVGGWVAVKWVGMSE